MTHNCIGWRGFSSEDFGRMDFFFIAITPSSIWCLDYLPIAGESIVEFTSFPRVLVPFESQIASSMIWIRVTGFISNDDNRYAMSTSNVVLCNLIETRWKTQLTNQPTNLTGVRLTRPSSDDDWVSGSKYHHQWSRTLQIYFAKSLNFVGSQSLYGNAR